MTNPDPEKDSKSDKFLFYKSPSRFAAMTPVRTALRSSNNNAFIFLDKLKQLDKFKRGIEELAVDRKPETVDENDPSDHQMSSC